jgi:hypothetical protein
VLQAFARHRLRRVLADRAFAAALERLAQGGQRARRVAAGAWLVARAWAAAAPGFAAPDRSGSRCTMSGSFGSAAASGSINAASGRLAQYFLGISRFIIASFSRAGLKMLR